MLDQENVKRKLTSMDQENVKRKEEKEEERLLNKWFFSPKRLTPGEIIKLKSMVDRPDSTIRPFIKELINDL